MTLHRTFAFPAEPFADGGSTGTVRAGTAAPTRSAPAGSTGGEAAILGAQLVDALPVDEGRDDGAPVRALSGDAPAAVPAAPAEVSGPAGGAEAALAPAVIAAPAVEADLVPDDPLYADQWHFPLMGDIETVWEEYSGAGVHVYITDDGVEYTHEDIAGNYDASMHFTHDGVTYDPMPVSSIDGHGTSCAGLIAAEQGNGLGGTGVAWGATLTGANFLEDTQYLATDIMLASLQWAENFDVMSNSWGITPGYSDSQSPFDTTPSNTQDDIAGVFEAISASGRGGLGTVVAQASGNDTMNAQGDALNATRFTVSVAATDEDGFATYYTNFGSCILIAAPAAAVTTDLDGSGGYDPTQYTDEFGGTSAATPVTAGMIALMLEANEGLGWRDVKNILAASASQTGTDYGQSPAGAASQYEQGDWFANGAGNWNGGGMSFNLTYGYGMIDAFAAVRMAEVWLDMHGEAQTSANESHVTASMNGPAVTLAAEATTIASIEVADDIAIENIQVTVDLDHDDRRDIEIWLVSPDGTEFMLYENDGGRRRPAEDLDWIFGVESARGMTSAGTWEIKVVDETADSSGVLNAASLDFYGSSLTTTEVHHFTEDFLALAQVDAARTVLHDDGGRDALNLAAVSGDIELDFAKGGSLSVDGVFWADFDTTGDFFEDAWTGDGNDSVTGNSIANRISGQRGDDILVGRSGNDTLDGGEGDDTLDGGQGADSVSGGAGDDLLTGKEGGDVLSGGDGHDVIEGNAGADLLLGEAGDDTLSGGINFDTIEGGDGNDSIEGKDGFDLVEGGAGDDALFGNNGNDTLDGGAGNDTLEGGQGADSVSGGAGDDLLTGKEGADMLSGGDGNDVIEGNAGADLLLGDAGDDTLDGGINFDTIEGGDGNDFIEGKDGFDLIDGGAGNDLLFGNNGHDTLLGGEGNDFLSGGFSPDRLEGGTGNDTLEGSDGADTLLGGDGDDLVSGGNGSDLVEGGAGDDLLTGGSQGDSFVFSDGFGQDTITDFGNGADVIDLSALAGITDFADLFANHVTDGALGAVVAVGGDTITIEGLFASDLAEADFLL